ncbi:MAG: hypothetical protein EXS36_09485 [Pedosphaera sp.]|nr:hypothetical protein [Pedosphaera sp.]
MTRSPSALDFSACLFRVLSAGTHRWRTCSRLRLLVFGVSSWALLTLNFGLNLFSMANSVWFELHQRDSECLVVARLVADRSGSAGSHAGLLGQYTNATILRKRDQVETQYRLYTGLETGLTNFTFVPYTHQVGLQAVLLGDVDRSVDSALAHAASWNLARPKYFVKIQENKIVLLQLVVAAVNAAIFSTLLCWFHLEFGSTTAWILLPLTLLSPWITVFGRNLYWIIGSWYLPMVAAALLCRWLGSGSTDALRQTVLVCLLAITMAVGVLFKSTMGYEFLSAVVLAQMSIVVYYAKLWRWSWLRLLVSLLVSGIASIGGFGAALWIHYHKLLHLSGGHSTEAIQSLTTFVSDRAIGDASSRAAEYGSHVSGNPVLVILKYVFGVWNLFPPFFIFLLPTVWVAVQVLRQKDSLTQGLQPLAWAYLFSWSAPLSWFVAARGHSMVHTHINYVLWHLPTMFFALALLVKWSLLHYTIRWEIVRTRLAPPCPRG